MFMLKFALYFTLSFFILSIPVQDSSLFDIINKYSSPYTDQIFSILKKKGAETLEESKKVGRQLYENSTPTKDSIKSTQSSAKKDEKPMHQDYTVEEQEILKKVLRNN